MKLSTETLQVLKNFQTFNDSLLIIPGKTLKTISPGATVLAEATVQEDFPHEVPIYDLTRLNQLFSMWPGAEVEFGEKHLTIISPAGGIVTYYYTFKPLLEPKLTYAVGGRKLWPAEIKAALPHETLKFQIQWADFATALKVANTLNLSSVSFQAKKGSGLYLRVVTPKNDTSNLYEKHICHADQAVNVVLKKENLSLLDRDYIITIAMMGTEGGYVTFESLDGNLKYWLNSVA